MNPTLPTSHWRPDHAPPREDNSSVRGQCSFHQWCKRTAPYPRGLPIHGQGTGTPCLQEVPMWQCLGSGFSKKKVWGQQQYLLLGQQMHSLFLPPSDRPSQNKTTHTTSQAIIFLQRVTTFRFIIQRVSKQQQSVIQQISCKNVGSQYKQIAWDPGFPDKSRHVDTRNLAN